MGARSVRARTRGQNLLVIYSIFYEGYCTTEFLIFCLFFSRGICTLLRCLYSSCTINIVHPVSLPYHLQHFFLQWAFCNCHGTCWHRLIYHSCRLGEPKTLPPEGNATIVRAICGKWMLFICISFKHTAEVYVLCTHVHERNSQKRQNIKRDSMKV